MLHLKAPIKANLKVAPGHYKMVIFAPEISRATRAGQFVHIKCSDGLLPLLRRPFSVHKKDDAEIHILYRIIGEGTRALSKHVPGSSVDLIGPLGNGFQVAEDCETFLLVAGGMGVASLLALAEEICSQFNVKRAKNLMVLIGARTKELLLAVQDFEKLGIPILTATQDGSQGFKGLVTGLFAEVIVSKGLSPSRTQVFACGPKLMLKRVAAIAAEHNMRCQVSLEELMACGVGACLSCVVKVRCEGKNVEEMGYQYKLICKDGPVFDVREVCWDE